MLYQQPLHFKRHSSFNWLGFLHIEIRVTNLATNNVDMANVQLLCKQCLKTQVKQRVELGLGGHSIGRLPPFYTQTILLCLVPLIYFSLNVLPPGSHVHFTTKLLWRNWRPLKRSSTVCGSIRLTAWIRRILHSDTRNQNIIFILFNRASETKTKLFFSMLKKASKWISSSCYINDTSREELIGNGWDL